MRRILVTILILIPWVATAQNRYMVFFTDKSGSLYSVNNPTAFLSQRSIDRRAKESITITEEDLPVNESYAEVVKNLGAKVLYRTKWMNGVLVECTSDLVATLDAEMFVSRVEYVAPGIRPASTGGRIRSGKLKESASAAAATDVQLSMLGLDQMHGNGYHGEGVLVAIMDAGFPGADVSTYFQHIFDENRFEASTSYDFVSGGSNIFREAEHGTNVWSIMGGYKQNDFVGGAYKARFVLFITEHAATEYRVEEYNWLFAAERADSLGVDVINTSLGYNEFNDASMNYTQTQMDGETAVITKASSIATRKGMAVIVSAGNEGRPGNPWRIITAPADGKDVLAVGAVTSTGVRSVFSSIGPAADGRIKPDVAALGSGVQFVTRTGTIGTGDGTSFASPLIASLTATLRQKFPNLSTPKLLDTIRMISSKASQPDNSLGYGIPNLLGIITVSEPPGIEMKVDVYPNPFSQNVTVVLDEAIIDATTIQLHDAKGTESSFGISRSGEDRLVIDLKDHAPGLYIIHFTSGSKSTTRKILKTE